MLKLNSQALEKIEALKNMLLSYVSGNSIDSNAYINLRDELFQVSGLKEALPKFMRTCSDLAAVYYFMKSDGRLSYASRRAYVEQQFAPLLNQQSPVEREVLFPKGSVHDAYVHIRAILQQARKALWIIDPYMDSTIYTLLGTVSTQTLAVQLLTHRVSPDFELEGTKFRTQHTSWTLHIRKTKDIHDRFLVVDEVTAYLLGASIKDAGSKTCAIVPLESFDLRKALVVHAASVWSTASVLL